MFHRLICAYLLVFIAASLTHAADVWRLAGTFNGWNTSDEAWRMTAIEDGRYELVRVIPRGRHTFKFVRNGDWSNGHFGDAGAGRLQQPGDDIELRITAPVEYRIVLSPNEQSWRMEVGRIEHPVLASRVFGGAVVDRPFRLDLSDSLLPPTSDGRIEIRPGRGFDVEQLDGRHQFRITPRQAGLLRIEAFTAFEGEEFTDTIDVDVAEAHVVRIEMGMGEPPIEYDMERLGDDRFVQLIEFDASKRVQAMEVMRGGQSLMSVRNLRVPEGGYLVEVTDGRVTTHDDRRYPICLLPGHWRRFTYDPRGIVESVHLAGDFNGWAGPGSPDAIALHSRMDGTWAEIIQLNPGAHTYKYVIDGDQWILDPDATSMPNEDGVINSVVIVGPRPEDFPEARPNHVLVDAVRHDPLSDRDFMPISDGLGLVDIAIHTLPNDVQGVELIIDAADPLTGLTQLTIPMRRERDLAGFDRFAARVMIERERAQYRFRLHDGRATHTTDMFDRRIEPGLDLPDWAMGAVWYQIFPERFRNGNPLNDPHGPGVFQMPWTADWYKTQPGEEGQWRQRASLKPNEPLPHRQGGPLYLWVWDRRYGGDLQGVQEKLDEMKDLGITALYLNPVFEAESMHKYDATDYRHIDDNFGRPKSAGQPPARWTHNRSETLDPSTWTWTPADRYFIDEFLPACRDRGIRVVIDGVFNHTGRDFWAFQDVLENGADSPYADWYFVEFDERGDVESWQAWDGPSGWLPKFRQTETGDLTPGVKQHLFDITTRWMDPNGDGDPSDGIDGWRLDVPLDVGEPFWVDWRRHVKSINPDAVIIAEIWQEADPWLRGRHFDTQMHYPFARPAVDWLGVRPETTAQDLGAGLNEAFDDMAQTNLIHQNLYDSHDTDRFVSQLQNPGRAYDDGNRIQDNGPNYKDGRPDRRTYAMARLGAALQATYLGAPMIYYGDEYGAWGADDPTNRKPIVWPDTGFPENADERIDSDQRDYYRTWFNLRQKERIGPVLRYGDVRNLETGDPDVFAFERSLNGDRVIVVLNRGDSAFGAHDLLPRGVSNTRVRGEEARYWFLPR